MWKGGKLKVEKAKEHYMNRLKREWAEDAGAINSAHNNHVDAHEDVVVAPKLKSSVDTEKMRIKIFFPKLRKVKSLPLCGTGKHKYSFQRVQAPSRPIHFCDCPEHSIPVESTHKKIKVENSVKSRFSNRDSCPGFENSQLLGDAELHDSEILDGGMNEEEISIMDSVMKKLIDKGTSKYEQKELGDSTPQIILTDFSANLHEIEDGTNEDDIKINVASDRSDGSFSESWELQSTSLVDEMVKSNERPSYIPTDFSFDMDKIEDGTDEDDIRINVASVRNNGSLSENSWTQLIGTGPSASSDKSTKGDSWLQKNSWTQLIGTGNSRSFSISQILRGDVHQKCDLQKPNASTSMGSDCNDATMNEPRTRITAFGDSLGSNFGSGAFNMRRKAAVSAPKASTTMNKNTDSLKKQTSSISLSGSGAGDSCPFMRNADSLKDWRSAKTALSGALKKERNNKK